MSHDYTFPRHAKFFLEKLVCLGKVGRRKLYCPWLEKKFVQITAGSKQGFFLYLNAFEFKSTRKNNILAFFLKTKPKLQT